MRREFFERTSLRFAFEIAPETMAIIPAAALAKVRGVGPKTAAKIVETFQKG